MGNPAGRCDPRKEKGEREKMGNPGGGRSTRGGAGGRWATTLISFLLSLFSCPFYLTSNAQTTSCFVGSVVLLGFWTATAALWRPTGRPSAGA